LSTSSNEAAKLFDSAITQLAFHDVDPVDGNLEQTMSKMLQADPKFVIGQTMKFAMQLLGDSPRMKPKLLYDVNQFVNGVVQDKTNVWEKMHLKALKSLLDEDLMSASRIYDEILFDHPQDNLALSLIYFMGLYTGQKTLMRNVPARVLKEYFPHDRFYGTIYGKLCFGYEECNQFEEAEKAGAIALNHTPNDIWAIHSMTHVKEETLRAREGLKLLADTENQWKPRASLVTHVNWHRALFHVQLGEFEQALTLWDDVIVKDATKCPDSFLLSDLTSLLMRLELENNNTMTKKLDLKERWREIGNLYDGILDNSMTINMFYDVHSLLGCLYGDKHENATKLINSLTEFSQKRHDYPKNWNCQNVADWGLTLSQGLKAFAESDYETALKLIRSVRFDYQTRIAGSRAQCDIINQVMIQSAIRSGDRRIAQLLLEERWAHCGNGSMLPETDSCLNQRLENEIIGMI